MDTSVNQSAEVKIFSEGTKQCGSNSPSLRSVVPASQCHSWANLAAAFAHRSLGFGCKGSFSACWASLGSAAGPDGPLLEGSQPSSLKEEGRSCLWSAHCALDSSLSVSRQRSRDALPAHSFVRFLLPFVLEITQLPAASPRCIVNGGPAPVALAMEDEDSLRLKLGGRLG